MLSEKARALKREYQRQWREKNPEKVVQYQEAYWERKARQQQELTLTDRARQLKAEGQSLREIAERLGISHTTVSRMLNQ